MDERRSEKLQKLHLRRLVRCESVNPLPTPHCAIAPGHFPEAVLLVQLVSACAIAINDFVQSTNEPEIFSIDVLSPRVGWTVWLGSILPITCFGTQSYPTADDGKS